MTHLSADELADALEHRLDHPRQAHLEACASCRQQLAELDAILDTARSVDVPEPSPLFWQHLSARVRTAIDAEPAAARGWREWLRWPVLAPVAALALVTLALVVSLPGPAIVDRDAVSVVEPAESGLDDRFAIVAELVGDLDWDTAVSAGFTVAPGTADQALNELTAPEQQELTRLLQAELTRAKS